MTHTQDFLFSTGKSSTQKSDKFWYPYELSSGRILLTVQKAITYILKTMQLEFWSAERKTLACCYTECKNYSLSSFSPRIICMQPFWKQMASTGQSCSMYPCLPSYQCILTTCVGPNVLGTHWMFSFICTHNNYYQLEVCRLCVSQEILHCHARVVSGHDSMIGTVACYKLDGPGFKVQWGQEYPDVFRAAQMPTQFPVQKGNEVLFWG